MTCITHLKPDDETVPRDDSGCRTWLYTQTSAKLTQGTEDAAARDAAGKGPAVVLSGGNQPTLAMEDTLHMLFDKHMPVLLKHHPAQVRPSSFVLCSCPPVRASISNLVPGPQQTLP
jgi:hypothetical protein